MVPATGSVTKIVSTAPVMESVVVIGSSVTARGRQLSIPSNAINVQIPSARKGGEILEDQLGLENVPDNVDVSTRVVGSCGMETVVESNEVMVW